MEHDWLWKTLVYGSYLDFNLIKRLREDFKTIGGVIYDENNYLVKTRIKKEGMEIKKIDVKKINWLGFFWI